MKDMGTINEEKDKKAQPIWSKLKNISSKDKKLLVKLSILFMIGVVLLGISSWGKNNDDGTASLNTPAPSYSQQEKDLENKLTHILSQVKGAGDVSVAVTLEEGPESVYATDTDEENSEEQKQSSSQLTEINDGPVLVKENPAKVRGAVIVASGAGDAMVKESLIQAAVSLLGIRSSQVAVIEKELTK